jgi:hypothetical protein
VVYWSSAQELHTMRNYAYPLLLSIAMTIGVAAAGCRPKNAPPPPAPRPASSATVQQIRASYARAYPESRVGVVIAALPEESLVAVGEVRGGDFRENQVVTFLDSDQRMLTTGTVVRLLEDSIHVRYDAPQRDGREPRVGDVMVRTPVGTGTL